MAKYLIKFEDCLNMSVNEFIDKINETEGIKLSDLKVRDLSYHNDDFIDPYYGIYIFKTNSQVLFIGKVSSMSFTERIGKHFDIRPTAWFNRLLFTICRDHKDFKVKLDELSIEEKRKFYKEASKYVFKEGRLILINMKNTDPINTFESILRGTAEPLNKLKNKKDGSIKLSNI